MGLLTLKAPLDSVESILRLFSLTITPIIGLIYVGRAQSIRGVILLGLLRTAGAGLGHVAGPALVEHQVLAPI